MVQNSPLPTATPNDERRLPVWMFVRLTAVGSLVQKEAHSSALEKEHLQAI